MANDTLIQDTLPSVYMIASALVITRIGIKALVYLHHPLWLGIGTAAASDEHVDILSLEAMSRKRVQDNAGAEWQLIIRRLIAQKHRSIMEYALREYLMLVIEDAYLRGCGTRVYD